MSPVQEHDARGQSDDRVGAAQQRACGLEKELAVRGRALGRVGVARRRLIRQGRPSGARGPARDPVRQAR